MKALVYSSKPFERELMDRANEGRHELTFNTSSLSDQTAKLSEGFDAIVVFTNDDVSAPIIAKIASYGVKYILTRSVGTDHIDLTEAENYSIKVLNVPAYSPQAIAEHAIALAMALARKLIPTYDSCRMFDFRIDEHMGFNFYKKTVGLIGLGRIGQAAAAIFKGMGCKVLAYDLLAISIERVEMVSFDELLEKSDIISIHVPLNRHTHYLINEESIAKMRMGVMLINTSRGGVINTKDVINALQDGTIGYLGLDVYEFEKGLFFEDHQISGCKDKLIASLMAFPNVIITPHQAFLTKEAVADIATNIINGLNKLQALE